jgi:hypothetical protein
VRDAVKKKLPEGGVPMPGKFRLPEADTAPAADAKSTNDKPAEKEGA